MTPEEELAGLLGGGDQSPEDELAAILGAGAPQQQQAPQPGMWDSILEGGSDAVRGLNSGLYWGGSDETEGALQSLAGEGDLSSNIEGARLANAQAETRSPWLYNAGKLAGTLPGMFVGPATAMGRMLTSGAQGMIGGALSSDSDSLDELGSDAAQGGMWGLGGGMVGEGLSAGLGWLGKKSENAGVGMRARNAGGTAGEFNAIRQNEGIDQMQSGLVDDFRSLGLADSWKPQSAADVYRKLGPEEGQPGIMQDAGRQMGGAIDAAGEAGVRGDWDSVRQSMDNTTRASMRGTPSPTAGQKQFAGEMGRIAEQELPAHMPINYVDDFALDEPMAAVKQWSGPDQPGGPVDPRMPPDLQAMGTPPREFDYIPPTREMGTPPQAQEDFLAPEPGYNPNLATPRDLQNQKMAFEAQGYPKDGAVRLESDAPRAEAYRGAAGAVRDELGNAMEGTPFNSDFLQGRETYAKASPIAQMAGSRAARNQAESAVSNPFTYGPAAAGGLLGGASAGIGGMVAGAAAGGMANSLARNYGQDVIGIGMQMAQRPLDVAGGAAQYAGRFSGNVGGQAQHAQDQTRGYLLPDAAFQMMQQPGALGPYEAQFWEAYKSPDSHATTTLISRLTQTDKRFQAEYLPKLRALTAENR